MRLRRKKENDKTWQFISAGLFIGLGLGFLYDKVTVALFLGLGFGFLISALTQNFKKHK